MDEIIDYCGKKGRTVNPGLVFMSVGTVLALTVMICFYRKNAVIACTAAFFIVFFSLIFTLGCWDPAQNNIAGKLK